MYCVISAHLWHGRKEGECFDGVGVCAHHRYNHDVYVWSRPVTTKVYHNLEVVLIVCRHRWM